MKAGRWPLALALLLPILVPLLLAVSVRGAGATGEPTGAVQQFGACLSAGGRGDLLLLIDQSGSLGGRRGTDPDAQRVKAAQGLLGQLTVSMQAHKAQLDVAVAGFDVAYQKVVDWQALTPQSVGGLQQQLSAFANRNTGLDTDYVNALDGARRELRDHAPPDQKSCQALLWFSDGQFSIEQRSSADKIRVGGLRKAYAPDARLDTKAGVSQATSAGNDELCRDGGLADQLRATGTAVIAVGLGTRPADFGFMNRIVTGADKCGHLPPTGELHQATDTDELFRAFDLLGDPTQLPVVGTQRVCPRTACDEVYRFVLDSSVRSVHLFADSNRNGVTVQVNSPDPAPAQTFSPDPSGSAVSSSLGGQRSTAHWTSAQQLDLTLDRGQDAGWVGQWSVVFVDPDPAAAGAPATTQLRITGDLSPGLQAQGAPKLAVGQPAEVTPVLRSDTDGREFPPATIAGAAVLTGELVVSGRAPLPLGTGPLVPGAPARVDLTGVPQGDAVLRLRLAVTTAGVPATLTTPAIPGTQLADRVVELPVTLVAPPRLPTFAAHATVPTARDGKPLRGTVAVTGPGCAWLDTGSLAVGTGPRESGAVTASAAASSPATCVELRDGQQADLPFQLTLAHPGNGTVSGVLKGEGSPGRGSTEAVANATVAFAGDVVAPVDTGKRVAFFLVALLLGIGLPLVFLYLAKWWAARIPGLSLLVGVVPARRDGPDVTREGLPFFLDPADLHYQDVPRSGARVLELAGTDVVLRTTPGWRPSAPGEVRVVTPHLAASGSAGSRRARDGLRLPLAVHNTWVGIVDAPDQEDLHVLLLVRGTAEVAVYDRIVEAVRTQLPRALDLLDGNTGPARPPASPPEPPAPRPYGPDDPYGAPPEGRGGDAPDIAPAARAPRRGSSPTSPKAPAAAPADPGTRAGSSERPDWYDAPPPPP